MTISKNALRMAAVEYGKRMVGTPYIWGGDDPIGGLDCSGLAQEVLSSVGLDPDGDQTADGLYRIFKSKQVGSPDGDWPSGALVFFGTASKVTHVGVSIGSGLMLEAGGGGSKTISRDAAINQNAFVRIRPINRLADFVACCDPFL